MGAGGQSETFEAQLLAERAWLHNAVVSRLASPNDADDIVQETTIKAWMHRETFDPARPIRPWLLTIARRVAIDAARRRTSVATEDCGAELEDSTQTEPDTMIVRDEMVEAIAAASTGLPDRYRRVLSHRFDANLSYAEIAAVEGTTVEAVKPLVSRARDRFRSAYEATGAAARLAVLPLVPASVRNILRRAARLGNVAEHHSLAAMTGACCVVAISILAGASIDRTATPTPEDDPRPASGAAGATSSSAVGSERDEPQDRGRRPIPDISSPSSAQDDPSTAGGLKFPRTTLVDITVDRTDQQTTVGHAPSGDEGGDAVVEPPTGAIEVECLDENASASPTCALVELLASAPVDDLVAPPARG